MKDKNQHKEKNINPLAAVSAGVVIGAGAAIAGAAVLKDKKTQERVKSVVKEIKKQMTGYVEDIQKTVDVKKDEGKEKLTEAKKELEEVTDSTKNTLKDTKKSI